MLSAMTSVVAAALMTGEEPARSGTAQPKIVPYQMFQCADAPIVAGAPNERLFQRFCAALERTEWLDDPRFQGNANRNRHRAEVVAAIQNVLVTRTAAEWVRRFAEHEIPSAPVATVMQALANPQLAARAAIVDTQHPKLGAIRQVANPMRMRGFEPDYRPAPELGVIRRELRRSFSEEGERTGWISKSSESSTLAAATTSRSGNRWTGCYFTTRRISSPTPSASA